MKTAFRNAEIRAPFGKLFHIFRDTAASWMLENGENIRTVQEILGHSQITMTQRYTHVLQDHKMTAMEKVVSRIRPANLKDGGEL